MGTGAWARAAPSVLLVDNHDSYTYNLFQLVAEVTGVGPVVLTNDDPTLAAMVADDLPGFDAVVISPGPGRPSVVRDLGHVPDLLRTSDRPVLGVCLGHQAIAYAAGAQVRPAPVPRHGHLTRVRHRDDELFAGIPREFVAVRYHSLRVEEPLPPELIATGWAEDGVLMSLRHRDLPRWGVQFHPESIATQHGRRLVGNFLDLAARSQPLARSEARDASGAVRSGPVRSGPVRSAIGAPGGGGTGGPVRRHRGPPPSTAPDLELRMVIAEVDAEVDGQALFDAYFARSPNCFWLDSSRVEPGLSRFSFLGDASGPLSEVLTYRVGSGSVRVRDAAGSRTEEGEIFDVLARRLAARRLGGARPPLPFDLTGGYVGFFGYELKADVAPSAPSAPPEPPEPPEGPGQVIIPAGHRSPVPDAMWIFADRLIAIDHEADRTYVIALHRVGPGDRDRALDWVAATAARVTTIPPPATGATTGAATASAAATGAATASAAATVDRDAEPYLVRGRSRYLADVAACQRELVRGESYEICLTNALRVPFGVDHGSDRTGGGPPTPTGRSDRGADCGLDGGDPGSDIGPADPPAHHAADADADAGFYRRLRTANPAPYGALIRVDGVTVFSSSPERFLRIERDGTVTAKPIKGTARRDPTDPIHDAVLAADLATDAKNQAENLMIVDLLRNDLGRVCEIGSVSVPRFMAVESYATVHHLVSTVRGRLDEAVDPLDCVRACFPGGSMTGAPKIRTMEILDRLETEARGVYAGALGYFGLGDRLGSGGGVDLSIAIRTAVRIGDELSIGAGGAVVLASDPVAEFDEMVLKAAAVLAAWRPPAPADPAT